MARKKRKYTRKKKFNFLIYLKKILKIVFLIFCLHLFYVNAKVFFVNISMWDVIIITGDSKQNSQNIADDLENKINSSLELFKDNKAKKIFVLWEKNQFKIDETSLITQYISNKDIWQGNIAFQTSSTHSYPKNVKLFLQENDWNSMIHVSEFSNYYKDIYFYSQRIHSDNIYIQSMYNWIFDLLVWSIKNYYYFWKI